MQRVWRKSGSDASGPAEEVLPFADIFVWIDAFAINHWVVKAKLDDGEEDKAVKPTWVVRANLNDVEADDDMLGRCSINDLPGRLCLHLVASPCLTPTRILLHLT